MNFAYDALCTRLLVGYADDNSVILAGYLPKIAVRQTSNVILLDGDSVLLRVPQGTNASITFTIVNNWFEQPHGPGHHHPWHRCAIL